MILVQKVSNEILRTVNEIDESESVNLLAVCDYSIRTLNAMQDAISILRPQINEMLKTLKDKG